MQFLQLLVSGLSLGSLYALIGLAFVLIYRASGVVNFAQGELMMLGSFFGFSLVSYLHFPVLLSYLVSMLLLFLLGFLLERFVFRHLRKAKAFSVVMVTIGFSTIFQGLAGLIWGHDFRNMPIPAELLGTFHLGSVSLSRLDLASIGLTFIILCVFSLFLRLHKLGRAILATASDLEAAYLTGIPVDFVYGFSWGLSASISVVAGIFVGSLVYLEPTMGVFALSSFPAIILGGLNSIVGAVIGGLLMGVVVNLAGGYLDAFIPGGIKEVIAYIVLLLVLMVRPYGFFGQHEIRRM